MGEEIKGACGMIPLNMRVQAPSTAQQRRNDGSPRAPRCAHREELLSGRDAQPRLQRRGVTREAQARQGGPGEVIGGRWLRGYGSTPSGRRGLNAAIHHC